MEKFKASAMEVLSNPTTKYLTIAGSLRKFGDMAITCFIPIFFLKTYPSNVKEYAYLNALILSICGFTSNIMGGFLGDKLEQSSEMAKGWICILSSLLSIPAMALCCWNHGNFWLSMAAMSIYILVSGCYNSNAITMMQNTVPSEQTGRIISGYSFYTNMS
jgi:MFS family permease